MESEKKKTVRALIKHGKGGEKQGQYVSILVMPSVRKGDSKNLGAVAGRLEYDRVAGGEGKATGEFSRYSTKG